MAVDSEGKSKQWLVHLKVGTVGTQLPLRENLLRFALVMNDGTTSNSWRVWVEKAGDAYICCRDARSEVKVSLHKSGRQHITCARQYSTELGSGERYLNTWREPPHQGPVVPSFRLMFPSWGVRLDEGDRNGADRMRRTWRDNQVLIEHHDRLMIAVDFIIRDDDFGIDGRGYPMEKLAVIPAPVDGRPNRHLFVIVSKVTDAHFRGIVQRALDRLPNTDAARIAVLRQTGEVPVALLTGYGDEAASHAYMICAPVTVSNDKSVTSPKPE